MHPYNIMNTVPARLKAISIMPMRMCHSYMELGGTCYSCIYYYYCSVNLHRKDVWWYTHYACAAFLCHTYPVRNAINYNIDCDAARRLLDGDYYVHK